MTPYLGSVGCLTYRGMTRDETAVCAVLGRPADRLGASDLSPFARCLRGWQGRPNRLSAKLTRGAAASFQLTASREWRANGT